ncbi:hypothetical protein NSU_4247 [Novosphingobium pentaromativorans US6-1]|uniref:Uncharacterized protein n=1 Tax=Novosphingobium pentaromativorans US6-1 TaxID=1088721 RepID=G6EIS6_9SPHN|nr:hypothetical protein NSU_4247 [Novosphingobium pentaromativorans US6-1]
MAARRRADQRIGITARAARGIVGQRARDGLRRRGRVRTDRERRFIDRSILVARGKAAVGKADRQRRGRGIAVAIGDGVDEAVGCPRRRYRIGVRLVGIAAVGAQDQRAVGARDASPAEVTGNRRRSVGAGGNAGDRRAVSPRDIVRQHTRRGHSQGAALGDRARIRKRRRHVVDDLDVEIVGGGIAVRIDDRDIERHGRAIGVRGIVVERIGIGDATVAGDRIESEIVDGQRTRLIARDNLREGTRRDDCAPDRDAGQAIVGMEGDRAGRRFGAADELRTGVLAIARIGRRGQLVLVDLGSFADLGHRNDHRRAVCDADRQRRSRDIAITVCHLIREDIGSAAAGSRSAHIAVGTIGEQRERAELAGHDRSGARKRAGSSGMHAGDAAAIGTEGIGARLTAGSALAAQDIAGLRGEVRGRDRVGIRAGNRSVVSDIDSQRRRGGIAIGIGDHDREHVRRAVATGIVGKLVSVGNLVAIECTQRQATKSAIDLLAGLTREHFAIDDNGADAIFRSDEDRAGGDVRPVSEL